MKDLNYRDLDTHELGFKRFIDYGIETKNIGELKYLYERIETFMYIYEFNKVIYHEYKMMLEKIKCHINILLKGESCG